MPRHKKTPGQFAPKNAPRNRKFSIVIHDVKPNSKQRLEQEINSLSPDWFLIAQEKYDHQDGSHIHLFLKYAQPKSKFTVLKFIQELDLGSRVQVDIGRGDFEQCKKYITDPDKLKSLDPNITENVKRLSLLEKYPHQTYQCPKCDKRHYVPDLPDCASLVPRISNGYTLCQDCWSAEINQIALRVLREKFTQDAA